MLPKVLDDIAKKVHITIKDYTQGIIVSEIGSKITLSAEILRRNEYRSRESFTERRNDSRNRNDYYNGDKTSSDVFDSIGMIDFSLVLTITIGEVIAGRVSMVLVLIDHENAVGSRIIVPIIRHRTVKTLVIGSALEVQVRTGRKKRIPEKYSP